MLHVEYDDIIMIMDGIMHIMLTILRFLVIFKALTTSFICQKSQMSRPITLCDTSQSLFVHDAFWRFS